MMRNIKGQLFTLMLFLTFILTTACSAKTTTSGNESFDTFIEQVSTEIEKNKNPQITESHLAKRKAYLKKLRSYNTDTLSQRQLLTRNVLVDLLDRELKLDDAEKKQNGVKNGKKKYYEALLAQKTGTDFSSEEAIEQLEKEVASVQEDINTLLEENEDLSLDYIGALPKLTDPNDIVKELELDTNIYYPAIKLVDYEIKEMPSNSSNGSNIASYVKPSIRKQETNTIYINSTRINSEDLFPTLAHETYPGHLYQINYALQKKFPKVRYLLTCEGYDEGWGMYAQMSAYEYLEFQDVDSTENKNLQELSRLNKILNIYLLSLSDLYVHSKNYKEDTLASYLKSYPIAPEQVGSIYDYVLKNPCDYPMYGLGYYEFAQLEETAKEKLVDSFDLKEFRRQVLDIGSCSFTTLKKSLGL